MSVTATIGISLLYLVPVALLAILLTAQHRPHARWFMVAVVSLMPLFYAGHYLMLQEMQGWPSSARLPNDFRLLGFDITEPATANGQNGQILLWVRSGDDDRPRVHRLPYERSLHQELVAAGQRQAQGRVQRGRRDRKAADPLAGTGGQSAEQIRFEDVEGARLPEKH